MHSFQQCKWKTLSQGWKEYAVASRHIAGNITLKTGEYHIIIDTELDRHFPEVTIERASAYY